MSELIDNRAHRVRTLKGIIKKLHAGEAPERVKNDLATIVKETDYSEIVAMEQELMAEGMPVEEIQCMCDLHSQVTREVLVQIPQATVPPGHPADTLRRENQALRGAVARARKAVEDADVLAFRQAHNELMDVEKHYQRKEHTFFPCLERHGITGPSKVMWAKHDELRGLLKNLGGAHQRVPEKAATDAALAAIEEMIYKEENIFLPLCLDTLTEDDWAEIWASSPRYGWCLVEPGEDYRPPESAVREALRLASNEAVQLPTGNLTLEQLTGLFSALPVDVTFVDADDRVAFFSEGPDRIFARSRAILGRKVQHCHPPRSVEVVDRILSDFREGRQSVAEFWIEMHGRFVHIRYFAVRGSDNQYLGTLEVTQDATRLRTLAGERRLLEYETPVEQTGDSAPAWVRAHRVRHAIDGDAMLEKGVHPMGKVRECIASLQGGETVKLTTSFRPAPLIDAIMKSGFEVYSEETAPGHYTTYISHPPASPGPDR